MVKKQYTWKDGATLLEHTKCKHDVLREYFARYLAVRCQLPQQSKFRLVIVEGFAGGGRYRCGAPGSPIIFIEELVKAIDAFNLKRSSEGMAALDIECFLIFNDEDRDTLSILKSNVAPVLAAANDEQPRLHLHVQYFNEPFEDAYPAIKELLKQGRYQNALFNLDQCGHSDVARRTLSEIAVSFTSAEIFLTFSITSLLAFLRKDNPKLVTDQLGFLGISSADLSPLESRMNNKEWLGAAERLVFEFFQSCATYVSPFSINNPGGWRYWLIHFANNFRARQEYNNVLHRNSTMQAHFGRSGLHMLSYDPRESTSSLYLFDVSGRARAKQQLLDDIPRLVTEFGDAIGVGQLYASIYNMTPAHADEIHSAMIENPDMEVVTEQGGTRRKPNTITVTDTLRMKRQFSFFPMFPVGKSQT
ncbi:three-Cys-motif partner protein TcmP [Pelagibius sp.]|uniref:three-Cys-motif partner protein TcmP n=1 Tax=Pelagibius sp. TaxID=1931238 RepID=UPI002604513A|nr:three-Cys-motif partner protein TcmP [Pelagibius sp.]